MTSQYSIEEARAKLGDLVTAARSGQTIIITRNGKPAAQLTRVQRGPTMPRFSNDRDVKASIVNAIEGRGHDTGATARAWTAVSEHEGRGAASADEYDLDAIFRKAYEWRIDHDEHGNELLNTGGFEQVVSDDEFWNIVADHHTATP